MDCVRYDAPEIGGTRGKGESTTINRLYCSKWIANLSSGSVSFFVSTSPGAAIRFKMAFASELVMVIDQAVNRLARRAWPRVTGLTPTRDCLYL